MTIRSKIAGAAILASLTLGLAAPAAAQGWNQGAQFRQQIDHLERKTDRNRGISNREERRLDNQISRLKKTYNRFARGGFNRHESQTMQRMIADVRYQFRNQARDGNRQARNDRRYRGW